MGEMGSLRKKESLAHLDDIGSLVLNGCVRRIPPWVAHPSTPRLSRRHKASVELRTVNAAVLGACEHLGEGEPRRTRQRPRAKVGERPAVVALVAHHTLRPVERAYEYRKSTSTGPTMAGCTPNVSHIDHETAAELRAQPSSERTACRRVAAVISSESSTVTYCRACTPIHAR